ncbi:hypothetical protein AHAS_Ahas19G0220700 [Arachis hypogaea]
MAILRIQFIDIWWWLTTIRISIIPIELVCTIRRIVLLVKWRRLFPRRLSISTYLLPQLTFLPKMRTGIEVTIPYNIVTTKLQAKRVRIHREKIK